MIFVEKEKFVTLCGMVQQEQDQDTLLIVKVKRNLPPVTEMLRDFVGRV